MGKQNLKEQSFPLVEKILTFKHFLIYNMHFPQLFKIPMHVGPSTNY